MTYSSCAIALVLIGSLVVTSLVVSGRVEPRRVVSPFLAVDEPSIVGPKPSIAYDPFQRSVDVKTSDAKDVVVPV